MQLRKSPPRKILVGKNREMLELATKLGMHLDSESVLHAVELGMKSPHSESQLFQKIKELEDRKESLDLEFRNIRPQRNSLESKLVGLRTQISKISRDNRVLALHLCARTFSDEDEQRMREEFIEKYLVNQKPNARPVTRAGN